MRQKTSLFINIILVITDIAFINTIYFSISIVKTPFIVGYLPWFLCGLCGFFVNSLFLKKPRTIPAIFGLNTVLFLAETGILLSLSANWGEIRFDLALISAMVITVSRESYLVLHPPSPQQRLLYTEASFFITLWLYFLQMSGYHAPISYNVIMFVVLLLNIASLIQYRISDESGSAPSLSKGWAILIFGGISASLALLLLLFSILSAPLRKATHSTLTFAGTVLKAILLLAGRVIEFLLSLIPVGKVDPYALEPALSVPKKVAEETRINPDAIKVLYLLLAAAVLAVIVFILYRLRNTRISAVFGGECRGQTQAHPAKESMVKRLIHAVLFKIRFFLLSVIYRTTPVGLLLSLERLGKDHKLPRLRGETNRLYINRMTASFDTLSGEEALPLFSRLADELDCVYFGRNGRSDDPLSSSEILYLKKKIRRANRTSQQKRRRSLKG